MTNYPQIYHEDGYNSSLRYDGRDWPTGAPTMIGHLRATDLCRRAKDVLERGVPGDFIEAGVWKGGAGLLLRACQEAYGCADRITYLADSFQGLPKPDADRYPVDAGDQHHTYAHLVIDLPRVKELIDSFALSSVVYVKGWFEDTLHKLLGPFALIRLDGDMYGSTIQSLDALYPKLSPGGWVIIDDYALPGSRHATDDFRRQHGIVAPLERIDWTGVAWRKP